MVATANFETRLFIDNQFVEATSGQTFTTLNPATEQILATIHEAGEKDVDKAVKAANKAFLEWETTVSGCERRNMLLKLADLMEKHLSELAELESLESGKPLSIARAVDLPLSIRHMRYYAGWADKIQGKVIPIDPLDKLPYFCYTRNEPVGVVAQIITWNFPLLMLAWKIAPALAVGCTVVLKTSEKTPLSALKLAELIPQAGFPPGVVNIISGRGPTTGDFLCRHPLVSKIAFTGSTVSGAKVQVVAAEAGMKRTTMELGGKSPLIVFADADIETAVRIANFGLFFNMGQCCIASSRVFVEESIHDKFVAAAIAKAKSAIIASPSDLQCTQGPQIDSIQFEKILKYIETGKKEGATCNTGGSRHGNKGYFIEPTVFSNVTDGMTIAKEEIFGPVMSIFKFKTVDEVVSRANDTKYGLGAGLVTKDLAKALTVTNRLRAGTVYVNCWDVFDAAAPFGGFKESGQGREGGEEGLSPYIETKTVIASLS